MDYNFLQLGTLLLSAGACGGILLALLMIFGARFPSWLGGLHGLIGVVGLILVWMFMLGDQVPMIEAPQILWASSASLTGDTAIYRNLWLGVSLVTLAMVAGVILFRLIWNTDMPLGLAVIHGLIGAIGLFFMYPYAFPQGLAWLFA